MRSNFGKRECEVVLVDAINLYTAINRKNLRIKYTTFTPYIDSAHPLPTDLFSSQVDDGNQRDQDHAAKGTTLGDTMAMAMYTPGMSDPQEKISCGITKV